MTKILYCQATWLEDFEDTKLCIKRVNPHVDATVIAYDARARDIVLKILEHFPGLRPKYVRAKLPPQIQEETMKMSRWIWKSEWSFDDAIDYTVAKFERYKEDWK